MKKVNILIILLLSLQTTLLAESVFLKNGKILEGKIKKDTDKEVSMTITGKDRTILRKNILRVLYGDEYKKKQFIFLNNNSVIEAYIVEESRDFYIYRKKINSAKETKIKKDKIKFISKKKITLSEMQKKKKMGKLISDRDSKFYNLLGLRFGAALLHSYDEANTTGILIDKESGALMTFGLFYYDKYFEFDWQFGLSFDDGDKTISHTYMFSLLPFNMFKNVGIGLTIGYTNLSFNLYNGKETGIFMDFQGVMIGLMYRYEGWFRIGLGYVAATNFEGEILTGGIREPMEEDESIYNFYAFLEVFVWKNLSISAHYFYTETNHDHLGNYVDFRTHFLSLQVSFALNVF